MSSETMPHHDVFQRAESLSTKERHDFWHGEGGDHLIRFNNSERHQCHLLLVMWHDFQELESSDQATNKEEYVKRTYDCLSKAKNSTRVIRQLQAFAHFVCDGGGNYIEPSKFIQCDSEVISQRLLFKKLVEKVSERVHKSQNEYLTAVARAAAGGSSSSRVLKNTSVKKQSLPKVIVESITLCEAVADEVLAEHPLISKIVSAEVKDGLPFYTIDFKGDIKGGVPVRTGKAYSYDALAERNENLSLLSTHNMEWKKKVAKIGEQIDPNTKKRTPTVIWRGDSQVTEVSRQFFEKVDWMDLYELVRSSLTDVKSAPLTPARRTSQHPGISSASSTPMTPEQQTVQQLHDLVNSFASGGMSATRLRTLYNQLRRAAEDESLLPAAETDKDVSSVMDEEEEEDNDSVSEEEREPSDGSDAEEEAEEEEARMDDDEEVDENEESQPRETRSTGSKRKPSTGLTSGKKKRPQTSRA
jgi:hypothetical protein